jgi:hypothetical protein
MKPIYMANPLYRSRELHFTTMVHIGPALAERLSGTDPVTEPGRVRQETMTCVQH